MFFVRMLILFVIIRNSYETLTIIKDLLQYNLAGHPVVHKEVEYVFDPDIGAKRSKMYQAVNGVHGEKAIQRLGLGFNGREDERLEKQKIRDLYLEQE